MTMAENAPASASLTEEEVKQYQEKGWIVPKWEIPQDLIAEMRQEYEALLERNPQVESDIILAPHQTNGGSMGIKGSEKWLEFASRPELMAIARQLIGDDIILWGTTLFGKPPHNGKETPWHQDGGYYPIRPLETLTMWIPLDDVTPDNGPMKFIPGSHTAHELFSHSWKDGKDKTINLVTDSEHFDEAQAEPLIIRAGQVSFHDVYMIHGSSATEPTNVARPSSCASCRQRRYTTTLFARRSARNTPRRATGCGHSTWSVDRTGPETTFL